MSSIPSVKQPSALRRFVSLALGIITLLCGGLHLLIHVFVAAQVYAGVYGGPELLLVAMFFLLPPAVICTILAMVLAGPRRSKLAWISLSSFAWPYGLMLNWMLVEGIISLFKK